MKPWVKLAAVVTPIALVGGFWGLSQKHEEPESPIVIEVPVAKPDSSQQTLVGAIEREPSKPSISQPVEEDVAAVVKAEPSLPPLKPVPEHLNHSDGSVLDVFADLSPSLAQWLVPEEQVRKWVLAVDLLADGKIPQRHLPLAYAAGPYKVDALSKVPGKERFAEVEGNTSRYDSLINAVVAVDPRTAGRYYRAWQPMLEQAYGELGKSGSFQQRLDKAVERLLKVQSLPGEPTLVQPHVFYEYESAALEKRSPLDKAVWRLGDNNREKLQAYLRELKFYL